MVLEPKLGVLCSAVARLSLILRLSRHHCSSYVKLCTYENRQNIPACCHVCVMQTKPTQFSKKSLRGFRRYSAIGRWSPGTKALTLESVQSDLFHDTDPRNLN